MRLAKGLQFVLADDDHADQPLYRRIYLRLREAIEDGVLTAGTRLPSTRTLARDLKVSRNTVAAAFDQLHADGYLNQRVGDGTYVAALAGGQAGETAAAETGAEAAPERATRGRRTARIAAGGKSGPHSDGRAKPLRPASALPASLTAHSIPVPGPQMQGVQMQSVQMQGMQAQGAASQPGFAQPSFSQPTLSQRGASFDPAGMVAAAMEPVCMLARPGVDLFPRGQWRQVMNEVINSRRADGFDVCDPAGHPDLRRAVARHLAISRGVVCDASQVIITTSGLQSVDLAIRVITDPGNQAWIEDPGCTETRATLLSAGLEIVPVPVDAQGLDVDYGRQMAPKAKLVYVTPHHQFPSGRAMSLDRRRALADWADRADAWVIEDEFDGDLLDPGTRLPCLQRLRHGRKTIHVGHFGLSLFPSVGVGYLVVPAGSAKRFAQAKRMIDGPASALNQLAVARFIENGYFEAHLRRMRHCYGERRAAILKALTKHAPYLHAVDDVETGLHLTLALAPQEARAAGALDDDRQLMAAAHAAGHQVPAVAAYVIKHRQLQGLVLGYAGIPAAQAEKVAAQLGQAFMQEAFRQAAGTSSARYA